jgi:thiamine-phosphate diphosphorylase
MVTPGVVPPGVVPPGVVRAGAGADGPAGVVLLTDRRLAGAPLVEVAAAAVAGGVRWVVLREKDLPRDERLELAERLRAVLAPVGGRLVVAGVDPLDGDAVHLPAAGPHPPPALPLVGRSCHDAAELGQLSTEDYVTLSPIYPTATKPGYGPALGPALAARLMAGCELARLPWLALGGVDRPERVAACVAAGAAGVAVLGAVLRAADPVLVARRLTEAFAVASVAAAPSVGAGVG